ncbi:putative phagosome-lysosome fusion [Trypoxylus dichotomus]
MFQEEDCYNRQISKFPQSFKNHSTFFHEDFDEATKIVCKLGTSNFLSNLKICKVIILGDLSVGKTCIVNRFCDQKFELFYKATIGVDFKVERFDILNVPFHLQIWDTAGQERFKCIAQSYYRAAHAIILVFDFSNISTLYNCKKWLEEALNAGNVDPFIFLVGTKKDLISEATYENIEVSAVKIANHLKAEYWPVSSKTSENINKLFFRIAALTFDRCIVRENEDSNIVINSELTSFKNKPQSSNNIQCSYHKCKNI